mmetsp:Transcript_14512/g.16222  ORF Transcript_14512/g.16222 Transcript_14512/m.16222 type:complete len:98 (+) Transcript_14512:443-736(+)
MTAVLMNSLILFNLRNKIEIYTKDGKKRKRYRELTKINPNIFKKHHSENVNDKIIKKRIKIKFEDFQISHIIGKGATAVVKLGRHITKKKNLVFKIY